MSLNKKQAKFALEYVVDFNATAAAKRAGYSEKTAYAQGHALLKKAEIQQKIQENIQKISDSTQITAEKVLNEVAKLAFYNPQDFFNPDGSLKQITELTPEQASCIAGMEIIDIPKKVAKIKKVKLTSRDAALDKLMRYLSLYRDKVEHSGEVTAKHDLSDPLKEALVNIYARKPDGST